MREVTQELFLKHFVIIEYFIDKVCKKQGRQDSSAIYHEI